MSKELEALEQLKDFIFEFELGNVDKHFVNGSFNIIEKALKDYEKQNDNYAKLLESVLNDKEHKALEIINTKQLDIYEIKTLIEYELPSKDATEIYNTYKDIVFQITVKEFDLLKEILK